MKNKKDSLKSKNEVVEMMRKKKNSNLSTSVILGAVVVLMVAIIFSGFYFLSNKKAPLSSSSSSSHSLLPSIEVKDQPQQILNSSAKAMSNVKSYVFSGSAKIDALVKKDAEEGKFNFNITMAGKGDQNDLNNPKSDCNVKLDLDVLTDGGSQSFSVDLDAMSFGQKKSYFKLNECDLGMLGMMIGPEINSSKGKWYLMDIDKIEQEITGDAPKIPQYDIKKIMEIYSKYELFKFKKDLGDKKVGNVDTYHYQVKLDGMALANFYVEIMKEMVKEMESEYKDKTFEEKFDKLFGNMEKDVEKYDYVINKITDKIEIEVWIGKNNQFVYKTKISGEFDEKFVKEIRNKMIARGDISIEEANINDKLDNLDFLLEFDINFEMSDFNKPVEIIEPENAEDLVETLGAYLLEPKPLVREPFNDPYDPWGIK